MTVDEYMGRLAGYGFTVCRRGTAHLILEGANKDFTGIAAPEGLTPEQRVEELSAFMRRNMLT